MLSVHINTGVNKREKMARKNAQNAPPRSAEGISEDICFLFPAPPLDVICVAVAVTKGYEDFATVLAPAANGRMLCRLSQLS